MKRNNVKPEYETYFTQRYGPVIRIVNYPHKEWIYHFDLREKNGEMLLYINGGGGIEYLTRCTESTVEEKCLHLITLSENRSWCESGGHNLNKSPAV